MPYFCGRLKTSGWLCFADEAIKANHTIVVEFYANDSKTNFVEEMATMTRGVRVDFSLTIINTNYRLPGADN